MHFPVTAPLVKKRLERSAELVGATPLHLLTQTALPLESPTGAFIATQTRIFQNCLFTGGVVTESSICSAAFCESAALQMPFSVTTLLVKRGFRKARRLF